MAALWNRTGHYIFMLWFLSSIFYLFSSPNLSDRKLDVYHTSTHGVALVRIQNAGLKRAARGSLKIHDATRMWPMPNVMVALPNTGGALCSTPQSLADAHYQMPCSNTAKTRNPLKYARVLQTTGSISAVSRPKFTILWDHVEDIQLLLNRFFPIDDRCLICEDVARQSCAMVPRWRFLATFFASCISNEPRAACFRPAS